MSYALGTAKKNLPTFVNIGRPRRPCNCRADTWARVTRQRRSSRRNAHSESVVPRVPAVRQRDRQMQALDEMDKQFRAIMRSIDIAGPTRAL